MNNTTDVELWLSKVRIVQVPKTIGKEIVTNPYNKERVEIQKSWLYDPFLDQSVYGLEITLSDYFSWVFFLNADSKQEATRRGNSLLMSYRERFPGLAGEVKAMPVSSDMLRQKKDFHELVLHGEFNGCDNYFSIIKKFIQLFGQFEGHVIQLIVMWQKDDSIGGNPRGKISIFENYKVKIFIRTTRTNEKIAEQQQWELEGKLDFLTTSIKNLKGERARYKKAPSNTWEKILRGEVFWKNLLNINTGMCYSNMRTRIPEEEFPAFLSPDRVDFTFPEDVPLPKANILKNKSIGYLEAPRKNDDILIGKEIDNGIPQERYIYIPKDNFAQSAFITGQTGTGKTRLLSAICNEIYEKVPHVGILNLNLASTNQTVLFKVDRTIIFGSPDLSVPYHVEGQYQEKSFQETASYLIASLGLKNVVDKNMLIVMKSFIKHEGGLPKSLVTLCDNLLLYFKRNPYHDKFQTNILRAIKNRVLSLLSDPVLDKTLELTSEVPRWFLEWRAGKKILIDLSMCNIHVKRLLTSAIFQLVRTLTPDIEPGRLQNIIVIDEAHQILEKPITNNPDDDDFIAREQLEIIFSALLREYRSKGLAFVFSDNTPWRLFECVLTLPSLKILFRLGHPCEELFTNDLEEQRFISLLKNRQAFVLNGITSDRFVMQTIDLDMYDKLAKHLPPRSFKIEEAD